MIEADVLQPLPATRTATRVGANGLLQALIASAFSLCLLSYIQFAGPNIVDYDGYYHIKTAELIRQQGLPLAFPWLKFTILDEAGYTDHHLLMHILQIPFTWTGDLRLAAKLAPVAMATFAFTIFYLLLRRYQINYSLAWLILLFASSSPFLYRMSMARGQSFALALQLLAFHLLMKRNSKGLFILAVIFVWSYNAFPLLVPLVGFGIAVHYISEKTVAYQCGLALIAGIIVGHVVNPYFPQNVFFLWNHIAPKLFAAEYQAAVGSEWYPFSSWALVSLSLVAFLCYIGGLLLTDRAEWKQDKARLFWFLTATMYLILLLKSRRFVEYFPPTAVLFFAFASRDRLQNLNWTRVVTLPVRVAGVVALSLLLWFAAYRTIGAAREEIRSEPSSTAYQGGARWLAANTPAGATVFHTDWDDFPKLFFYNTHNTYIIGLDPDFMRLKDARLYHLYEDITQGRVPDMEDAIVKEFGCEYVFTDHHHREFMEIANQSPRMQKVFADRHTTVYRVLNYPQVSQPPSAASAQ